MFKKNCGFRVDVSKPNKGIVNRKVDRYDIVELIA